MSERRLHFQREPIRIHHSDSLGGADPIAETAFQYSPRTITRAGQINFAHRHARGAPQRIPCRLRPCSGARVRQRKAETGDQRKRQRYRQRHAEAYAQRGIRRVDQQQRSEQ